MEEIVKRGGGYDPKTFMSWYDAELRELYVEEAKAEVKSIESEVKAIVDEFVGWVVGSGYLPGMYLLSTYLFPVRNIVPFLAAPPQITHPDVYAPAVHPKTYIDMFVPHGRSRNVISRYFFGEFYPVLQMHMVKRLAERVPELGKLYSSKLRQYLEKGDSRKVARSKAYKDVVRVYVGNAWLVWQYYAYETGLVRSVVLPYHLAKEPALHAYMVDPARMVLYGKLIDPGELKDVTWRWLVETASRK